MSDKKNNMSENSTTPDTKKSTDAKPEESKHKKSKNDGMNTPVPDNTSTHVPSESEAALLKQAENPLGDPDKI